MKTCLISVIILLVSISALPTLAGTWIDEFKGGELGPEWTTRDRPGNPTKFEVKNGALRMICQPNFGHMVAERPLALIKAPEGDFVTTGLFSTEPDKPGDAWHGIFVLGEDPMNFACLLFGGESNQAQKTLIGSMVEGTWQDKGHFPTGFDVPFYLKLEKKKDLWSGYCKEGEKDDWTLIGGPWNHAFEPKWVGVGFINNWGAVTVTLITEFFSIEGDKVVPGLGPVEPIMKLSSLWGRLKSE